ncbi:MAG TPA: low molecular weight protein-tyrosine-phosphatase [Burkholderiales bacterium]|nr:low molecular weight protein-tyrosine-phosphatase [Burkholderiales bacterium]
MRKVRVLFVCTGNICRSPMAEVVFRRYAEQAGLVRSLTVDSAGTHDFNVGQEPDDRARSVAASRGYEMKGMRARQVRRDDFKYFDYLLAMDEGNLAVLRELCPSNYLRKLGLFMQYSAKFPGLEIPDPYHRGSASFERVLDLVENAAIGLLDHIRRELTAETANGQ